MSLHYILFIQEIKYYQSNNERCFSKNRNTLKYFLLRSAYFLLSSIQEHYCWISIYSKRYPNLEICVESKIKFFVTPNTEHTIY